MNMEDLLKSEWRQWWIVYISSPSQSNDEICKKLENKKLSVTITGLRGKTMYDFRQLSDEFRTGVCDGILHIFDDVGCNEVCIEICEDVVTHNGHFAKSRFSNDYENVALYFVFHGKTMPFYPNVINASYFFNQNTFKIDDEMFHVNYHMQCILLAIMHEHYDENKCQELFVEFIFADCFLMKTIMQY